MCKAYDSRLATYEEIENAYESGGEWCAYGWSEGQMAYFPTQKSTFDELQKTVRQKNNCGRPGVNGGYMANPNLRFGVNCYGVKPEMKNTDEALMSASKVPHTTRQQTIKSSTKIQKKIDEITISGFNYNSWNAYEKI